MGDRRIGETFRFGYDTVITCEAAPNEFACGNCILYAAGVCLKYEAPEMFGSCSAPLRTDKKQVYFKYITTIRL